MATNSPERRPQRGALAEVGNLAGAGVQFAATVALCTAGGWWLDGKLGSSPWLLLVGALFGAVAAFYHLYRSLVDTDTDTDTKDAGDEDAC